MEETRVEKYKDYRKSIITEGAPIEETSIEGRKKFRSDTLGSTTTLPLDQVMQALDEDKKSKKEINHHRKKEIIKYSVIIGVFTLIVIGLIIFAIIAFK